MKESTHQFRCRDDLWKRVTTLAERRGIQTDEVLQAALVQLFSRRTQSRDLPTPSTRSGDTPPPPPPSASRSSTIGARHTNSAVPPRKLYLFCEGSWYTIDKDEFVIGRGQKYSDLPIKDANISRRHCAVVRKNGKFYMTDLGSTNGIEFKGERVNDHLVEEGSVYTLCDHELRFTYVSPT